MERSGHGLFVVLPQHLPGWTEKTLEHLTIVFVPDEIRRALLPNIRIAAGGTNLLRGSSLVIFNLHQSVALVIALHADLINRSKRTAPRWRNWFFKLHC